MTRLLIEKGDYSTILFSQEQMDKYHKDPRWAKVTKFISQIKYSKANDLVLKIMEDHKCFVE